jgi:hypothetical protein
MLVVAIFIEYSHVLCYVPPMCQGFIYLFIYHLEMQKFTISCVMGLVFVITSLSHFGGWGVVGVQKICIFLVYILYYFGGKFLMNSSNF